MKSGALFFGSLLAMGAFAKSVDLSGIPWSDKLKEAKVREFFVCGNSKIRPTRKSLKRDVLAGTPKKGFVLSDMMSIERYRSIISEHNLDKAKSKLHDELSDCHLWEMAEDGTVRDLGTPSKIELLMTATVKDCVEGSKTSLGIDCSHLNEKDKKVCCGEKFVGPSIYWGNRSEYALLYSPDPSVRLKVPHESNHRYCNLQEIIASPK